MVVVAASAITQSFVMASRRGRGGQNNTDQRLSSVNFRLAIFRFLRLLLPCLSIPILTRCVCDSSKQLHHHVLRIVPNGLGWLRYDKQTRRYGRVWSKTPRLASMLAGAGAGAGIWHMGTGRGAFPIDDQIVINGAIINHSPPHTHPPIPQASGLVWVEKGYF